MRVTTSALPGFPTNWESETIAILKPYERKHAHLVPELELRSRVLQKLVHARVTNSTHLAVLVSKVVRQVLLDHIKAQRRHHSHVTYDSTFDCAAPDSGLTPFLQDRLESLLGPMSPLLPDEKALLKLILEDPVSFIRGDGHPEQSALARHFDVNQSTISRRWHQIVRKVAALHPEQPDLSI